MAQVQAVAINHVSLSQVLRNGGGGSFKQCYVMDYYFFLRLFCIIKCFEKSQ